MNLKQLPVLVRREFWEHRNMFLVVPAAVTGFFVAVLLLMMLASTETVLNISIDAESDAELIREHFIADDVYRYALAFLAEKPAAERGEFVRGGMLALASPLLIVLWFVIFFYLLGALYDDRRDRSILFWKSMPVSDGMTVLSKLITAVVVVPVVFVAGAALLQLSALFLLSVSALGTDYSAWQLAWSPASLLSTWFGYLALLAFYALWALPFFGWLLAVSSFARSVPLVWALGVPLAISIVEGIFSNRSVVSPWIQAHTVPIRFLDQQSPMAENMLANLFSMQMLSALVVGGALIFLAIWLRSKADEI